MMEDLVEPDPLSTKEEQEPELVQVKEEEEEGEFLKIKEEEEEPELAQIKKEEEEPAPFHLKVEEEPEHLHVKKEEEEAEPPQMKEEEEELGISHDEEQPGLKQQADTCMQTLVFKVKDHREQEPSSICLLTENSAETENLKQEGNDDEDSGSSRVLIPSPPTERTSHRTPTKKNLQDVCSQPRTVCGGE
ncbi:hypothetical protein ILYODFUR_031036 [Ilyodon furcidens]|uniref:Uncharacterized protein n=1 Tax=Ilyodon furcidens TaxID=33524 RepID=A0ABV0U1Y2_9TELE